MTIGSTAVQTSGSTGSGTTGPFSFTFRVQSYGANTVANQIEVVKVTIATGVEETLTYATDYSISANGDQDTSPGGSVTLTSSLSSSYKLYIRRAPAYTQETDITPQGSFNAQTHETQFDQVALQVLDLLDRIKGAPHFGVQKGSGFDGRVRAAPTAGQIPYVNNDADGYEFGSPSSVTVSSALTAFVQEGTLAEARETLNGGVAWSISTAMAAVLEAATVAKAVALLGVSGRNLVLNGCARVWQDGTAITSTSVPANNDDTYIADQIILLSDGNDIVDVSQETTTVPTGAYASFKFDIETANKKFGFLMPLTARDSASLINGNAVLSFEARKGGSNATAETLRAAIISWQGTADSITSDVVSAWNAAGADPTLAASWTYETTPQNLTLTTSFQKFDEDNGLSGAVDTASTKQCAVFVWLDDTDATVGDLIYIGNIQLERGLVATPFEQRAFSEEWRRSRFFYRKSYNHGTAPGASTQVGAKFFAARGADQVDRWTVTFDEMRATPTVVVYSTTGASGNVRNLTDGSDLSASSTGVGQGGIVAYPTANATANRIYGFHYTADARL